MYETFLSVCLSVVYLCTVYMRMYYLLILGRVRVHPSLPGGPVRLPFLLPHAAAVRCRLGPGQPRRSVTLRRGRRSAEETPDIAEAERDAEDDDNYDHYDKDRGPR